MSLYRWWMENWHGAVFCREHPGRNVRLVPEGHKGFPAGLLHRRHSIETLSVLTLTGTRILWCPVCEAFKKQQRIL